MALYKGTALVSSINGKLGDNIFTTWKNEKVVKSAPLSVNDPNTASQHGIRKVVGSSSSAWNAILTPEQRAGWETYARFLPNLQKNPSGIRRLAPGTPNTITGKDAYVMTNVWLFSAGLPVVINAPLSGAQPAAPTFSSVIYDPLHAPVGAILVIWFDPIGVDPASKIRVWIASPQHLFHNQIVGAFYTGLQTVAIETVRGTLGHFILIQGLVDSRVFLQMDCVTPLGRKSMLSECFEFVITP